MASTPHRVHNFSAGPGMLPMEVLNEAHANFYDYKGCGKSVMEMSHRSPEFESILSDATSSLKKLLNVPDNYKILFLQGGGTGQFAAVAMNLLRDKKSADYVVTGEWSKKSLAEAKKYLTPNAVFDGSKSNYTTIPTTPVKVNDDAAYLYYCDNETIHGVEFQGPLPVESGKNPILVCDMSSNFLSRPVDVSKFGLIYAGAQKNSGIAGVTIVIVRDDLIGKASPITPTVFDYKVMADNTSMLNTPPCWSIYIAGLVYQWTLKQGGVAAMAEAAKKKSSLLYDTIDNSNGFYTCPVDKQCRSRMNVPFRLADDKLDGKFLAEAAKLNLTDLKGHRVVGGMRASLYNAVSVESTEALVAFMKQFQQQSSKL